MVRSAKPSRKKRTPLPAVASVIDSAPLAFIDGPDGYFWQAPDGHQGGDPFESYELAQAGRDAVGDEALAPGETLQEVSVSLQDVTSALSWCHRPCELTAYFPGLTAEVFTHMTFEDQGR